MAERTSLKRPENLFPGLEETFHGEGPLDPFRQIFSRLPGETCKQEKEKQKQSLLGGGGLQLRVSFIFPQTYLCSI